MKEAARSRIVLTHWNAGVFQLASLPRLLPELVIYALLYEDVLIREEDLLTNRHITRLLSDPTHLRVFEELISAGLVKLLRLPIEAYPQGRRFDPERLPISARVDEHQLRRSYKGQPWRPTQSEWRLFGQLDQILTRNPCAAQFHRPFPPDNPFAAELAELLENRDQYHLGLHPVFRYIHPKSADAFIQFCREPEAWQRFLRDSGVKSIITGPDGGFYRSAAYQCFKLLPRPRSMRRLVESVYAATYCDREVSDGRYSGSELIELPYRYDFEAEREFASDTITKIEVEPTDAVVAVAIGPGVATVLSRTRESPAFSEMQRVLENLGSPIEGYLPTDGAFFQAWNNLCAVYTQNFTNLLLPHSRLDERIPRYSVFVYVMSRVLGFIVLPHEIGRLEVPTDTAVIAGIEKLGPSLLRGFRALLRTPVVKDSVYRAATVRCSRVSLNTKRR